MKLFTSIKGIARGIERHLEEGRTAKAKERSLSARGAKMDGTKVG